MSGRTRLVLTLALTILLSLPTAKTFAHGEPLITVEPPVAAAGSSITITGIDMEPGEVFNLVLENGSMSINLGQATAVGEGEEAGFALMVDLPGDLPPGSYVVRASTEEGETADADLTVTAPSQEAESGPAMVLQASAEPHALERGKPLPKVAAVVALAFSSAVAGVWLIRKK